MAARLARLVAAVGGVVVAGGGCGTGVAVTVTAGGGGVGVAVAAVAAVAVAASGGTAVGGVGGSVRIGPYFDSRGGEGGEAGAGDGWVDTECTALDALGTVD